MARATTGARLQKRWEGLAATTLDITVAGTYPLSGSLAITVPTTVLRMIGEYIIAPTAVIQSQDQIFFTVGIAVISTDAATLGATAMPDPLGEPGFPWLYYMGHSLQWGAACSGTAGQGPQGAAGSLRHSFDVKTMRKIKPRETLIMIGEYTDSAGTPPISVLTGPTRVLVGR